MSEERLKEIEQVLAEGGTGWRSVIVIQELIAEVRRLQEEHRVIMGACEVVYAVPPEAPY